MALEICSKTRYTQPLFILMCCALIGSIIFSFGDYEKVKNEEKRDRLEKMIKVLAEKVTALANDSTRKIEVQSMKRHVEQAYATLRAIDQGNPYSSPTAADEIPL